MGRFLQILAAAALVLVVALAVADRVATYYAEKAVGEQVAVGLAEREISSAPPEVTITGYPFLTQVLGGNYDEIRVNLRNVEASGLPIPLLEVQAYDVRASMNGLLDGTETPIATKVDGVGTLSYAELVEASGLDDVVLSGDGDELRISGDVPVAGVLSGAAKIKVIDGRISIQVTELTAANASAETQEVIDQYTQALGTTTFSLPEMPFRLKLVAVTPGLGGLEVSMTASEVELG